MISQDYARHNRYDGICGGDGRIYDDVYEPKHNDTSPRDNDCECEYSSGGNGAAYGNDNKLGNNSSNRENTIPHGKDPRKNHRSMVGEHILVRKCNSDHKCIHYPLSVRQLSSCCVHQHQWWQHPGKYPYPARLELPQSTPLFHRFQ